MKELFDSIDEARAGAMGDHYRFIRDMRTGLGYANPSWSGKPLATYIFKDGEKFYLTKRTYADLEDGGYHINPDSGMWSGTSAMLDEDDLEGVAAMVVTIMGGSVMLKLATEHISRCGLRISKSPYLFGSRMSGIHGMKPTGSTRQRNVGKSMSVRERLRLVKSRKVLERPRLLMRAGLLLLILWVPGSLHAAGVQDGDSWPELVDQIQVGFDEHEKGIDEVITLIEGQKPFLVERRLGGGLRVKWSKESPKIDPPDDLQERLMPLFEYLGMHAVQYESGVIQFILTLTTVRFQNFEIMPVLVRAPLLSPPIICTESLLVDKEEDYGRCLLPLRQKGWYVDMAWTRWPTPGSRADAPDI